MGIAGVKIKIMPTSPEVDLEEIQTLVKDLIESKGGRNTTFTQEPIAFGLNAIIAFFAWNEEQELELLEENLKQVKNVNSVQVIDMRRAFG